MILCDLERERGVSSRPDLGTSVLQPDKGDPYPSLHGKASGRHPAFVEMMFVLLCAWTSFEGGTVCSASSADCATS